MLIKYRYVFEYACPQIFCFDGIRVLAITFPAGTRDEIKTVHPVVVVTQVSTGAADGIFVLCRLITTGFHRLLAEYYSIPITIGVYVRVFQW